ncbi:MAG: protein kinase domain-containing protein [Planctomycetota bacterium]|jgi:tetratricopeptide (TPR) repeat protein/tRNA A-37 threonylcarbamoyl transferase component Bud32
MTISSDEILFGRIAISRGYITQDQLTECVAYQAKQEPGKFLGDILLTRDYMTLEQIAEVLAIQDERIGNRIKELKDKREDVLTGKRYIDDRLSEKQKLRDALKGETGSETASAPEIPRERGTLDSEALTHILEQHNIWVFRCAACEQEVRMESAELPSEAVCPECGKPMAYEPEMMPDFEDVPSDIRTAETEILPHRLHGQVFGRYVIYEKLGAGGMGMVYRAEDTTLNKEVALKLLPGGSEASEPHVKRFYQEARAAAKLLHPNIVHVHDVGSHRGRHYISMSYVDGPTLKDIFSEKKIKFHELLEIIEKIARALHYAHKSGIIHRDIKPSNILANRAGEPFITDFGLARDLQSVDRLTRSKVLMGTLEFMSPEQAEGRMDFVDSRSDIYSLGIVLYEGITGETPFKGESTPAIIQQIIGKDPAPPRKLNRNISRDVEVICLKAIEKDPARRYGSAEEFANDINAYLTGDTISARPASIFYKAWKKLKRNKAVFGVSTAAALAVILMLGYFIGMPRYREYLEIKTENEIRAAAKAFVERASKEGRDALSELAGLSGDNTSVVEQKAGGINESYSREGVLEACRAHLCKRFPRDMLNANKIAAETTDRDYREHEILIKANTLAGEIISEAAKARRSSDIPPEAVKFFAAAFRLGFPHRAPEACTALFQMAEHCTQNRMAPIAHKQYRRVVELFPDSPEAAFAHFRLGNFDEARKHFSVMKPKSENDRLPENMVELCSTFAHGTTYEQIEAITCDAGDLDGDGCAEIAVVPTHKNFVEIYRIDKGRLRVITVIELESTKESYRGKACSVHIRDFNNDGRDELFVFEGGYDRSICTGTWFALRDGKPVKLSEIKLRYTVLCDGVAVGDADNDGDKDILIGTAAMVRQAFVFDSISNVGDNKLIFENSDVASAEIEDIDLDGRNEILLGLGPWNDYELRILRYDESTGNYSILDRQFFGGSSYTKLLDLDGDGIPEIICSRPAGMERNPYMLGPDSVNQAPGGLYIFHFEGDKLHCRAKQISPMYHGGFEKMVHIRSRYVGFCSHRTPDYTAFGIAMSRGNNIFRDFHFEYVLHRSATENRLGSYTLSSGDVDGDGDEEILASSGPLTIFGLPSARDSKETSEDILTETDAGSRQYGPLFVGNILLEMKHYGEAILAFDALIAGDSDDIAYRAQLRKADCFGFMEDYRNAALLCMRARELYPPGAKEAMLKQAWFVSRECLWHESLSLYENAGREFSLSLEEQDLVESQVEWLRDLIGLEKILHLEFSAGEPRVLLTRAPGRFRAENGKLTCMTERRSDEYLFVPVRIEGNCIRFEFDINPCRIDWDSQPYFGFFRRKQDERTQFESCLYISVEVDTCYSNLNINPNLHLYLSDNVYSSAYNIFPERNRWYTISVTYIRSRNEVIAEIKDRRSGKPVGNFRTILLQDLTEGDYMFGVCSSSRAGGDFISRIEIDNLSLWADPRCKIRKPEFQEDRERINNLIERSGALEVYGDRAGALKLLDEAIEISGGNCWEAFHARAILRYRMGKPDDGREDIMKAAKLDWESFLSRVNEDYCYVPKNCELIEIMLEAARERPDLKIEGDPKEIWDAELNDRDADGWLRNLAAASLCMKQNPTDSEAIHNYALGLYRNNFIRRAIEIADDWCRSDPDNSAAFHLAATLHNRIFQSDIALKAINRALELDPDNADYYNAKASIHATALDIPEAIKAYRETLKHLTDEDEKTEERKKRLGEVIGKLERSLRPFVLEPEPF